MASGRADGQDQNANATDVMVAPPPEARSASSRRPSSPMAVATPWLWLPVALSSMLLVLFVVIVNRQQAQAERIGSLLGRVRTLEQSRAVERTAVLEQQLRSMLTRLQDQEKLSRQQEQLVQKLQTLQQELQQLRSSVNRLSALEPPPPTELPTRPERRQASEAPSSP